LLVDTESLALRAWEETLDARGVPFPHALWTGWIGGVGADLAMREHLAELIGHADAEAMRERWWDRHLALVDSAPLQPGVAGYLAEAVRLGLGLAVASSATGDWVAAHLRRLGTHEAFTVVATGDRYPAKPAPDTYLGALDGLGIPPGQAVAFEDSPTGVTAAKAAGLHCVAVPNPVTAALDFAGADLVVPSLAGIALPDLLARLGLRPA